jgi:hypothetical protein
MIESRSLVRVTSQILNRPLVVTPRHASVILSALRSELNIALIEQVEGPRLDRMAMAGIAAEARAGSPPLNSDWSTVITVKSKLGRQHAQQRALTPAPRAATRLCSAIARP